MVRDQDFYCVFILFFNTFIKYVMLTIWVCVYHSTNPDETLYRSFMHLSKNV